jgi:hypothetical protein
MYAEALQRTLESHRLLIGLIASTSGEIFCRTGDFDNPVFRGLMISPEGYHPWIPTTPEDIRFMSDWLNGMMLPRTPMQGDTFAILMKPKDGMLAVVGGTRANCDGIELYHHAKAVNETLVKELSRVRTENK